PSKPDSKPGNSNKPSTGLFNGSDTCDTSTRLNRFTKKCRCVGFNLDGCCFMIRGRGSRVCRSWMRFVIWRGLFPVWKKRVRELCAAGEEACEVSRTRILASCWKRWRARKLEKVSLDWCIKHEDLLTRRIGETKRRMFLTWLDSCRRQVSLKRRSEMVIAASGDIRMRKFLLYWIEQMNRNVARLAYAETESEMHLKSVAFKEWYRRYRSIWLATVEHRSQFQAKFFTKWIDVCTRNKSLAERLKTFRDSQAKRTERDVFRRWRVKKRGIYFDIA
ncbi:hypothetical protein HDU98_005390, partial [Podochytrium sp. JEL0797]